MKKQKVLFFDAEVELCLGDMFVARERHSVVDLPYRVRGFYKVAHSDGEAVRLIVESLASGYLVTLDPLKHIFVSKDVIIDEELLYGQKKKSCSCK